MCVRVCDKQLCAGYCFCADTPTCHTKHTVARRMQDVGPRQTNKETSEATGNRRARIEVPWIAGKQMVANGYNSIIE